MSLPVVNQPEFNIQQSLQFLMNNVASINSTLSTSLPALNAKVDSFICELNEAKKDIADNREDIKNVFSEVFDLKDQVNTMRDQLNSSNQRERHLCLRIFGLPLSEDEINGPDPAKATMKQAYDRIIKPLLTAARDRSAIPSVPKNASDVIREAFRLKSDPSKRSPPAILLKLSSDLYKTVIFKSKRDHLPAPTDAEKSSGIKRFDVVEDLTPANRECLMELRNHPRVARAWTVSGEIRFTMKEDSTSYVYKVKSPFSPTSDILPKLASSSTPSTRA